MNKQRTRCHNENSHLIFSTKLRKENYSIQHQIIESSSSKVYLSISNIDDIKFFETI